MSISLNSTILINTTITSKNVDDYDYRGAAIYAAGILICYSTGLVLMLFFHVRPRTFKHQFIFDYEAMDGSKSSLTNPFAYYDHIQNNNTRKQILNELKDPDRRERLWKIYYSSKEKQNQPDSQYYQTIASDSATIGLINRKLATIHRMNAADNIDIDLKSSSNTTTKFFSKPFNSIRRFSMVQTKSRPPLPPLIRVHSEPDTPTVKEAAHSFISEIQSKIKSINDSHEPMNKFLHRFTIEKVSDNINKDTK